MMTIKKSRFRTMNEKYAAFGITDQFMGSDEKLSIGGVYYVGDYSLFKG
ncbi:hypothetical protein [Metabacillus litoralis]|nr:hypothetical protein [Metabacillus litoralis]